MTSNPVVSSDSSILTTDPIGSESLGENLTVLIEEDGQLVKLLAI